MLELVGAEAMRPEAAVEIVNQVAQALAQTKVWWKDLDKQPGVPVVSRDHMANRLWRQAMHIVRGKGKAGRHAFVRGRREGQEAPCMSASCSTTAAQETRDVFDCRHPRLRSISELLSRTPGGDKDIRYKDI